MKLFSLAAVLTVLTTCAQAAVLDFSARPDALPAGPPPAQYGNQAYCEYEADHCYTQNGFAYQMSWFHDHQGLSLDDEGLKDSWVYRPDGQTFSVSSVMIEEARRDTRPHKSGDGPAPDITDQAAYDAWRVAGGGWDGDIYGIYGIRDGVITGSHTFQFVADYTPIALGGGFQDIDALMFSIILPFGQIFFDGDDIPSASWNCFGDYCTGFGIASMVYEAGDVIQTPIPASMLLMLTGLAGLGYMGRRKSA